MGTSAKTSSQLPKVQRGVYCFEGDWSRRNSDRTSVEPALRLLQDAGAARYIHRNVATVDALEHYAWRWLGRGMSTYKVGFFAFHGTQRTLYLSSGESVTLDQLGELLQGRCARRILYFGSCSTLAVSDDELIDFCKRTGAKGVVGYTKSVPFIEAAAFEVLLLNTVLGMSNVRSTYKRLRTHHPVLTKTLGLRMAHTTWASDRFIAEAAAKS